MDFHDKLEAGPDDSPPSASSAVAILRCAIALGMSLYVWRMPGRVEHSEMSAANTQPVAPPISGSTEQVTLYVAYDDVGVLRPKLMRIPLPVGRQERAAETLRALLTLYLDKYSPHPLGAGSQNSRPLSGRSRDSPSSISTPPSPTAIAPACWSRSSPWSRSRPDVVGKPSRHHSGQVSGRGKGTRHAGWPRRPFKCAGIAAVTQSSLNCRMRGEFVSLGGWLQGRALAALK